MSGFFGMVRLDGQPVGESLLKEIAEELRFRGPDGVGVASAGGSGQTQNPVSYRRASCRMRQGIRVEWRRCKNRQRGRRVEGS